MPGKVFVFKARYDKLSELTCYICRKFGHRRDDCSKYDPNQKNKERRPPKWCSLHKTTTHSDDECKARRKEHNPLQREQKCKEG